MTDIQQKLLRQLGRAPVFVAYGDPHASALLLGGYAVRDTAFGKLKIAPAGVAALKDHPDE